MNNQFSVYVSPLSEETTKLRRNAMLSSLICLFIAYTEKLPQKLSLLGITFDSPEKQMVVGWFLFFVSSYLFLHFISVASIEVAKWLHPLVSQKILKSDLLKHPAFDETDFIEGFPGHPIDEQDLNIITEAAKKDADRHTYKRLRFLYGFIYIRLFIEILLPVIIGIYGLYKLGLLITS